MFDLSVIIPSHNKSQYISKCLESIFSQTFGVKEVIVFDDKSTDNTLDILHAFQEQHDNLVVIQSQENVGVSRARDAAIKRVTADYITFIDADDFYYDSGKLEREMQIVMDVYEKTGKKVCAYSQTVLVNDAGERTDHLRIFNWDRFLRFGTITRVYKYWVPRDFCFPRECYELCGGYDFELSLYEDWDFNLRLMAICDFRFSGGYGTAYRLNTGGLSSLAGKKHFEKKTYVFDKNDCVLHYHLTERYVFRIMMSLALLKSRLRGGG